MQQLPSLLTKKPVFPWYHWSGRTWRVTGITLGLVKAEDSRTVRPSLSTVENPAEWLSKQNGISTWIMCQYHSSKR